MSGSQRTQAAEAQSKAQGLEPGSFWRQRPGRQSRAVTMTGRTMMVAQGQGQLQTQARAGNTEGYGVEQRREGI